MLSIMPRRLSLFDNYFKLATQLFHEYQWVYDFKATDVLSEQVIHSIPIDFQNFACRGLQEEAYQQFLDILHLDDKDDGKWPELLRKFVADCKLLLCLADELKLNNRIESATPVSDTSVKLPRKWTAKKYFEVIHVGNFVGRVATAEKCDLVVEIGSGLAYLSSHLASHFKLPVIGFESEDCRVRTAQDNYQKNQPGSSGGKVTQTYICLRISQNISEEIAPYIFNSSNSCITALHACGDLTPWALKHFVTSDTCRVVAIVPCCYHKMESATDSLNFPMSNGLKEFLDTEYKDDVKFLKNQWLWRLASQRAGSKFLNDVEKETRNMFYRAILERYISKEDLVLKRRKRRNAGDSSVLNFQQYLETTLGSTGGFDVFKVSREEKTKVELLSIANRLTSLHDEMRSWSRIITGILALQGAIQIIAEEFILLDRLRFLEEHETVKTSGIIRVIPEDITPRGMVLYGIKSDSEKA